MALEEVRVLALCEIYPAQLHSVVLGDAHLLDG